MPALSAGTASPAVSVGFSHPKVFSDAYQSKTTRASTGVFMNENVIGQVSKARLQSHQYDVIILGGGPTGVAAATEAAYLGRSALLVDQPKAEPDKATGLDLSFGGPTGLFSKALRDTAKTLDIRTLRSMNMEEEVIWKQVQAMVTKLATLNAHYQVSRLEELKVDYVQGTACLLDNNKVQVVYPGAGCITVRCDNILLATGSKPRRFANIPFDDYTVFDSDSINSLSFLPKSVAISGSSIIAVEYARIFQALGAEVTMLMRGTLKNSLERIKIDPDVVDALITELTECGVKVLPETTPAEFDVPPTICEPVTISLQTRGAPSPPPLQVDIFMASMGRTPNTADLGLQQIRVQTGEQGHILVDDNMRTSVPGIYAAGDVIGRPSLASTGVVQGTTAIEAMFSEGKAPTKINSNFPIGIWTLPEVGLYGLTKKTAEERGMVVEEGLAKFDNCLRGRVFAPKGLLKLVFRQSDGVIVGVHIMGTDACELIHYGMELVDSEKSIFDLMKVVFTAVTFSELFKVAAIDGNNKLLFGIQWQGVLRELGAALGTELSLREKFDSLDVNKDERISAEELKEMLNTKFGMSLSMGAVANMVRLMDEDGSGDICFEEFETIAAAALCAINPQADECSLPESFTEQVALTSPVTAAPEQREMAAPTA